MDVTADLLLQIFRLLIEIFALVIQIIRIGERNLQLAHIPLPASPHYTMTLEDVSNDDLSDDADDLELFSVSDVKGNNVDDDSSDEHYEY